MPLAGKHLLGIEGLSLEDIELILRTSRSFKEISLRPIKKVPTLRGKSVINLFYEPSTRTRSSFEIAAKRLSADAINFSVSQSSSVKGESLIDTAKNLQSMNPDIIVVRHSAAGVPHLLSKYCDASIVNAGDGMHEHPTQALLDALTILDNTRFISFELINWRVLSSPPLWKIDEAKVSSPVNEFKGNEPGVVQDC